MTIKIIMHRLLDCNDVVEHDKAIYADAYQCKIDKVLENLKSVCCEHDFYYVVEVDL